MEYCDVKYEFCFDIHEYENNDVKGIVKSYRTVSNFLTFAAMYVGGVEGSLCGSLLTFQIF